MRQTPDSSLESPDALYVHIPFCNSRCSYCAFLSSAPVDPGLAEALVDATLVRAADLVARFGASGIRSLYIGGGTPSALPRPLLARLLRTLGKLLPSPILEWTVEANPEGIDEGFLDLLVAEGVGRLSLGIQSLDSGTLRVLGRSCGPESSLRALRLASGRMPRLSADLMAGIPSRGGSAEDARILLDEGIGHLSVYDLVLEEGTPLEQASRRGGFIPLGEDEAADEREALDSLAASRGMIRYEVSNYAYPGQESRHNLVYWRSGSWIAAGPGAVGTLQPSEPGRPALRIEEGSSLPAYAAGGAVRLAREEEVAPATLALEYLMMGLRTAEGVDLAGFRRRFGFDLAAALAPALATWSGRLGVRGDRLAVDQGGFDILNRILVDCSLALDAVLAARRDGGARPAS